MDDWNDEMIRIHRQRMKQEFYRNLPYMLLYMGMVVLFFGSGMGAV